MPNRRPLVAAVLLVIFVVGCYGPGWRPYTVVTSPQPDVRQVIAFEAGGQNYQLHAIRVTQDSISGIPWTEHVTCDTCRVAFARKDIVNVRAGDPGRGGLSIVVPFASILGGLMLLAYLVCGNGRCS